MATPSENLLEAASRGDLAGVERALSRGAQVDAKGPRGNTALNEAAQSGQTEIVKRLLEAGAHVDNKGGSHMTPLMNAACHGHFEIVPLLIEKGALVSDDLLSTIQTKINILEENAEGGTVRPGGVEAWKEALAYLVTERLRQDFPDLAKALAEASDTEERRDLIARLAEAARRGVDVSRAVTRVADLVSDGDAATRGYASAALTQHAMRARDWEAVRRLLVGDTEQKAGAIGELVFGAADGIDLSALVSTIIGLFEDPAPETRRNATLTLAFSAKHKVDVSSATAALARLLSDPVPLVRRGAAVALYRIADAGADVSGAISALKARLADGDENTKRFAAEALKKATPKKV
jgi:plasmid stabilization system protein ParE